MKIVDETSDMMYIDELCMKLEGAESSADIYVHNSNEKVTIEFEITDLVRLNNFMNALKYDHDGIIAKSLGVKMTRFDITPRGRATTLFENVTSGTADLYDLRPAFATRAEEKSGKAIDPRTRVLITPDRPITIDRAVIEQKQYKESPTITKQDTAEYDYLQEKYSREMGY